MWAVAGAGVVMHITNAPQDAPLWWKPWSRTRDAA